MEGSGETRFGPTPEESRRTEGTSRSPAERGFRHEKDEVIELKRGVNERGETVFLPASPAEARQAEELRKREELIQEKIRQLPPPYRAWVEDPNLRKVMISDKTLLESTPAELVEMFEYTFEDMRRAFRERPELVDKLLEPIEQEIKKGAARGQQSVEGEERRALR